MKNPDRVAELLAELRDLAENDFERHRLDVLQRDLTAPPQVEIIDDIHQRFDGVIYREDKRNHHYHEEKSLHRAVWEYFEGEIPKGYVIHHIDGNPANNNITNLQILTVAEHRKIHSKDRIKRICSHCEKEFIGAPNSKFCSWECQYRNKHPLPTKKTIELTCPVCGKSFTSYPHNNQKYCSQECYHKAIVDKFPPKKCAWCGEEFRPDPNVYNDAECCSLSCAGLLREKRRRNGTLPKAQLENRIAGVQNKPSKKIMQKKQIQQSLFKPLPEENSDATPQKGHS